MLTEYISADRRSALNGQLTPQRLTQTLNFSGGARLNVPLMTKGRLTGDIRRTYSDNQSTGFSQGVAQPTPASGFDYWNGRLELSWDL